METWIIRDWLTWQHWISLDKIIYSNTVQCFIRQSSLVKLYVCHNIIHDVIYIIGTCVSVWETVRSQLPNLSWDLTAWAWECVWVMQSQVKLCFIQNIHNTSFHQVCPLCQFIATFCREIKLEISMRRNNILLQITS